MADCASSEGWGQGLEPWGTGPAHAINDSNAKLDFSIGPVHMHQASPGEQGARKGQTLQGTGQGRQDFPRGTKESQPETRGGKSRTNDRRSEVPEVPEHIQLDNQSGLPFVRLQASPGECLQNHPRTEKHWPGQRENWWGWIIVWCFLGNLLCLCCKRRNRPGRSRQGRKECPTKESGVNREMAGCHGQRRPSPRGPRKSVRTAPSCTERPSQPGGETRFSHGKNAQSQSQSAEVRGTTPPGGRILVRCPCRRRGGQLRAEGSPRKCGPKTAGSPPGGCRYAIVLRGHKRSDRYVTAMRPSGHGGMRRRLRGAGQKGTNRPICLPQENSPGDSQIGQSSVSGQASQQCKHSAGCGEEWWGWILGGNTTWGSRGPPRALQPSPATSKSRGPPRALQPFPATSKSCKPHAACAPPEPARREGQSKGDTERHRDPKSAQRANAGLDLPRDWSRQSQPSMRPEVFRKPVMAKRVLILILILSSPGRKLRSDATAHVDVMTGYPHSTSVAPGDPQPDALLPEVPLLGCSEHAHRSKQWSKNERDTGASQRGNQAGQEAQEDHETGRHDQLSDMKAPGASDMCHSLHTTQTPMSDMKLSVQVVTVLGTPSLHQDRMSMHMPGMTHDLSSYVCSHVGYKQCSRSVTCPGQCAHPNLGRFDTCPGQRAHSSKSRLATCPGQCALTGRTATCPGQCAQNLRSRSPTCSEQLESRSYTCSEQLAQTHRSTCPGQRDPMAQSRERSASLNEELAELKFWTYSLGCKNLRDCVDKVPASCRSLDVPQSDWWNEPGITQRREALRELTTIDIAHIIDTRCLRDIDDNSEPKHLGTHVVNMRGMCHNKNMRTLIKDVWTCIEDLLREAYQHAKPGFRVDVALGFVCNSGRHRSVCISEMTTAVLHRMGIVADVDHLCESGWSHLCQSRPMPGM